MVLLTVTPAIEHGLQRLRALRLEQSSPAAEHRDDDTALAPGTEEHSDYSLPSETLDDLLRGVDNLGPQCGHPISHDQVLGLSKALKKNNIDSHHLDALLRGSTIWTAPKPEPKEPSSEYKALMARLRRDQEAREYDQMIKPTNPATSYSGNLPLSSAANAFKSTEAFIEESPDDEATYADINRQVALIINVLVSIVACSAALWMVARWWSTPARLALSFGGSILVAAAEVTIYYGYIYKVKESIREEKKIKEVKTIVRTWAVGQDDEMDPKAPKIEKTPALIAPIQEEELIRRRKK